jgi:hypothetical protein
VVVVCELRADSGGTKCCRRMLVCGCGGRAGRGGRPGRACGAAAGGGSGGAFWAGLLVAVVEDRGVEDVLW